MSDPLLSPLARRAAELGDHFHSPFDFDGFKTKPPHVERRFQRRLRLLPIPADLSGKTVLDVGAWDGFFSFEFERRGAKRVLAVDAWGDPKSLDAFLLAREAMNSTVEYRRLDVHDLSPEAIGTFDSCSVRACSTTCGTLYWDWNGSAATTRGPSLFFKGSESELQDRVDARPADAERFSDRRGPL